MGRGAGQGVRDARSSDFRVVVFVVLEGISLSFLTLLDLSSTV